MSHRQSEWDPNLHDEVDDRMAQLAEMRATCPVAYTGARGGQWTVARYKDLMAVASDPATFSNGKAPRFGRRLPPLEVDPPEHMTFRRTLQRFWLPSRIKALEPRVQASAASLLDPLIERGGGDLARDYAYPLPVFALCALLGISDENWGDIKRWAEESLGAESDDPDERNAARAAHDHLMAHAHQIVADRRLNPRNPEEDVATALLDLEVEGVTIDDDLVAGVLRLLISAGHNSTTNALGNILLYLAGNPDAQELLRQEPERIPQAMEELLRYATPVQDMPRYATRDVELAGRTISAGDRLGLLWGSGNRDEEIFEEPDRCILDRRPNRHLAFGYGIHTCLGAPMARMELRVAVHELLSRTRSFSVDGEVKRKGYHHMGVSHLPLRFEF
jgi:cytochrome P450